MSTATTKRKGLVLSVAALVVGLAAAFVLGEILLRVYQHVNPTFVFPDRSYNRFRGKPHADDYSFKLNSKGFKDVEFDTRKRPGEIRIIGIGDSFVFGVVPYENNFLTLLEDRLHAEGLPVEIINMGIPGTSPRDYLSVFLHEAFDLEADIVLLCLFVGNDFEESQRPPLIQSYVASLIRYLIIRQQFWNGHVVHGVKTYDDDEERMPEGKYLEIATARSHVFRRHDTAFRETFHNTVSYVKHIRDLCRQQHSDLLVVVLPDEMQVDDELQRKVMSQVPAHPDEWDFRLPNRLLASELDTLGIKSIDLLDAFKTISSPHSRLYRRNDSHWNIAGNRIAADNLARHLSSMLQKP